MRQILNILELVIALLIILLVLLQAKGTGLGTTFGGSGEFYSARRGVEKIVFQLTILLTIAFAVVSFGLLLLQ